MRTMSFTAQRENLRSLFPNAKDRAAFAKTKESRQIDQCIDSLPEPPVQPQRREFSGKFNVPRAQVAPRRTGR